MTIADLIERLEKATGPDRELDREIGITIDGWLPGQSSTMITPNGPVSYAGLIYVPSDKTHYADHPGSMYPSFTESVDTAIGLCERVLPGWIWRVATCSVSDDAWVIPDFNCPVHGERLKCDLPEVWAQRDPLEFLGTDIDLRPSGRAAIALCISVLTAVERINKLKAEGQGI
jgi:hypothetical protein